MLLVVSDSFITPKSEYTYNSTMNAAENETFDKGNDNSVNLNDMSSIENIVNNDKNELASSMETINGKLSKTTENEILEKGYSTANIDNSDSKKAEESFNKLTFANAVKKSNEILVNENNSNSNIFSDFSEKKNNGKVINSECFIEKNISCNRNIVDDFVEIPDCKEEKEKSSSDIDLDRTEYSSVKSESVESVNITEKNDADETDIIGEVLQPTDSINNKKMSTTSDVDDMDKTENNSVKNKNIESINTTEKNDADETNIVDELIQPIDSINNKQISTTINVDMDETEGNSTKNECAGNINNNEENITEGFVKIPDSELYEQKPSSKEVLIENKCFESISTNEKNVVIEENIADGIQVPGVKNNNQKAATNDSIEKTENDLKKDFVNEKANKNTNLTISEDKPIISLFNDVMVVIPDPGLDFNKISSDSEKSNCGENNNSEEKSVKVQENKVIDTLDLLLSDEEMECDNIIKNKQTPTLKEASKMVDDDDLIVVDDIPKLNTEIDKEEKLKDVNSDKLTLNGYIKEEIETPVKNGSDSTDISETVNTMDTCDNLSDNIIQNSDLKDNSNGDESMPIDNSISLEYMNSFKPTLGNMTREQLEEFCIVKIVEAIKYQSDLNIKAEKIKEMYSRIEILRKSIAMMAKQNRDLDIVTKNLINEHNKRKNELIEPVKVSRSVGFQVGPSGLRKQQKPLQKAILHNNIGSDTTKTFAPNQNNQSLAMNVQSLHGAVKTNGINYLSVVPSGNTPPKSIQTPSTTPKVVSTPPAALKSVPTPSTTPKSVPTTPTAPKRALDESIDLTEDEPPMKQSNISKPKMVFNKFHNKKTIENTAAQKMPQNANTYRFTNANNYLRKIAPSLTKTSNAPGPRFNDVTNSRLGIPIKANATAVATYGARALQEYKHPAPLPVTSGPRFSSPNWKMVPLKPDLKISKVSNGIVISWDHDIKMDSRYEEVASYQIYAYQETKSPPSTEMWKKIGDVLALALPMACTLTQFMSGFKYYFAVRAVDVKSRTGPFSNPACILLTEH